MHTQIYGRREIGPACARALLVASLLIVTACDNDRAASPTAPTVPTTTTATTAPTATTAATDTPAATPSTSSAGASASTSSGAQASSVPATPGNLRLEQRSGSQLRLLWDWSAGAHHFDLTYAGRTIVLNQYYPGHTQDVGDLDLNPGRTYTFSLRAISESGTASSPVQLVFETTPPQPARDLVQLSTNQGYPDRISFTPAQDDAGPIRHYEAFVDGRSFGSIGFVDREFSLFRAVFEAYISVPCGHVPVQLRAFDTSLNASPLSAPLTVFFPC